MVRGSKGLFKDSLENTSKLDELIERVEVYPPPSIYERAIIKAIITSMGKSKGQVLGVTTKRVASILCEESRKDRWRIGVLLRRVAYKFGAGPSTGSDRVVLLDLEKLRSMQPEELVRELIKAMRGD